MKSMIRMALLGLFVAAPSVMAKLPFRNAPTRLDGIYIQKVGLSSKEIKAINNGFGMWLQNTGTWRVVSSATDPDRLITVKVEKIDGAKPGNPVCNNPKDIVCIAEVKDPFEIDGINASIKIYTKYMLNGVPTANPNWNDYAFWTNFATSAVGILLAGWTHEAYEYEAVSGFNDIITLPAQDACTISQYLRGIGRATQVCSMNNVYEISRTGGLPILEFRRYRKSDGVLIARVPAINNPHNTAKMAGNTQGGLLFWNRNDGTYLELESAKWVLGGPATVTFYQSRITDPNQTPRCYENTYPQAYYTFYAGFWWNSSFGKGEASSIARQSTPEGDYFVKNATNGCALNLGYAGAVTP